MVATTARKVFVWLGASTLFLFLFGYLLVGAALSANEEKEVLEAQVEALHAHVERLMFMYSVENGDVPDETLSKDEIAVVMEGGIDWLSRSVETEGEMAGHYRYEYAPFTDEYLNDDNIVRQAGTFFQAGEMARAIFGEPHKLEELMRLNAEYFASISQADVRDEELFRCIVEHPRSSRCKLGATSLALIGFVSFVEVFPEYEAEYKDLMEDYVDFILAMKKEEGGFADRFVIDMSVQSDKESSFSNGEAMLALARYYRYKPREEILPVLEEMFSYIDSEEVEFDSPLYLWAMAALRDMYAIEPNQAYIDYAKRYTDWRVDGFLRRKVTHHNMCAYIEGVGSAYALLKEGNADYDLPSLQKEIDFWLLKTEDLQIKEDEQYRVVGTEEGGIELKKILDLETASGGFLTSYKTHTQRIDYTQHCLNAYLLRYQEL